MTITKREIAYEITSLSRAVAALERLDARAQKRAAEYLYDRYVVHPTAAVAPQQEGTGDGR